MEHYDCMNNFERVFSGNEVSSYEQNPEGDKVLVEHRLGNDINYGNGLALHIAVLDRNVDKVKELLKYGAAIHLTDPCHLTALHRAVILGNSDIVKELLKYGSNVNVMNKCGFTPLHDAVLTKNLELVKTLLKYGACVHTLSRNGFTPLKLALGQRNNKIMEELLKYGTNTSEDLQNCYEVLNTLSSNLWYAQLLVKYILIRTCEYNFFSLLKSSPYMQYHFERCVLAFFFRKCVCEILRMKSTMVNARLTLYDFVMLKNPNIVLCPVNKNIRQIVDRRRLIVHCPIYSNLILPKVERGILLNKLNNLYPYTYRCASSMKPERVTLDYECTLFLTQYLPDDDLQSFIQAYCK